MSRRSVRKRRNALPPPAGRFDFDIDGWVNDAGALMSRPTSPTAFERMLTLDPPSLSAELRRRIMSYSNPSHGLLVAERAEMVERLASIDTAGLATGTLALIGSTYYRLEEAAPGVPSFIDLATYPYEPGWSLRVAAQPRRGYFRKVVIR